MNSTPSSTPSQGTQLVGWPLQAGLARTEFSQFFSFTGTVQSTSDVWCGRLLKMTHAVSFFLKTRVHEKSARTSGAARKIKALSFSKIVLEIYS